MIAHTPLIRTTVACDLCGASQSTEVMRKHGALVREPFSVRKCVVCGLVYVSPRLNDAAIEGLYDDAYYRGEGFDRSVDYQRTIHSDAQRARTIAQIIDSVRAAAGTLAGKTAIDVGCGNGDLLVALGREGARSLGVESSAAGRALCAMRGVTAIDWADLAARRPARGFDVVTAIEVIEHVTSPTEFLASMKALLAPGGVLFLSTGNWNLVRRIPGTPYVMPEGHIYYFTPATLRAYLRKAELAERDAPNYTWFLWRLLPSSWHRAATPSMSVMRWLARSLVPGYAQMPIATTSVSAATTTS